MELGLRRQVVNIGLVVAAVALIGVVIATTGRVTTTEQEARPNNVLTAFREDELSKIERDAAGKKLVLERRPSGDAGDSSWFLREPVGEEADVYAVEKLSGSLEFATWVRRIKPGEVDRAAFGLDAPRWVMNIEMGKIHYRLALGKDAVSPPGSAYLEVSGEGVARPGIGIVSRDLVSELGVSSDELRNRQIVPYTSTELGRMVLEGEGGRRALRRAEWGGWRFDGMNGDVRVNREALDRVLLQFARTKAERFIDPAAADKALAGQKTVRVTLVPEDKQRRPARVEVGGACPNADGQVAALRREPDRLAGCALSNVMPGWATTADELIDRALYSIHADEVESLSAVEGTRRLEIARQGSGFVMRVPQNADVDLEAGNQRIQTLLDARGELVSAADPKALGFDPPRGSVTLKGSGAQGKPSQEETVLVGARAADGSVHVQRKQDGAVLKLSRELARILTPDTALLRSRKIFDFGASAFASLEVRVGNLTERFVRKESGGFTLELPKGFDIDAGLASDLVEGLRALSADRWAAERDDGSFGFDHPSLKAKLRFAGGDAGETEKVLVVGAPTSGGAFAMLEGDPGVFVLPSPAFEALKRPIIDRSIFVLVPETALKVSLEAGGKTVVLERQAERFSQNGGNVQLTDARVQQVAEALEQMRAETAIELGAPKPEYGFSEPELSVRIERQASEVSDRIVSYRIGAGDSFRGTSVYYARAAGVDATFVIARNKVRQVLDAL